MAVRTIAHKPDLTPEQLQAIFATHFEGKYRIETFKGPFRDFSIIRNPYVGVSVKLHQDADSTKIVYTGYAPAWWARLFVGLISFLFWNGLTNQVEAYIESAPEFK